MIDFGNSQGGFVPSEELEFVAGGDLAFFGDGKIKTTTSALRESLDHVVSLEFGGEFKTRKPRRRYLHHGGADAIAVANRNVGFQQPFGGEIFPERTPRARRIGEARVPCRVMLQG